LSLDAIKNHITHNTLDRIWVGIGSIVPKKDSILYIVNSKSKSIEEFEMNINCLVSKIINENLETYKFEIKNNLSAEFAKNIARAVGYSDQEIKAQINELSNSQSSSSQFQTITTQNNTIVEGVFYNVSPKNYNFIKVRKID
jgi:hypothetical protein